MILIGVDSVAVHAPVDKTADDVAVTVMSAVYVEVVMPPVGNAAVNIGGVPPFTGIVAEVPVVGEAEELKLVVSVAASGAVGTVHEMLEETLVAIAMSPRLKATPEHVATPSAP